MSFKEYHLFHGSVLGFGDKDENYPVLCPQLRSWFGKKKKKKILIWWELYLYIADGNGSQNVVIENHKTLR